MKGRTSLLSINNSIFYPTLIFLLAIITYSLYDNESFLVFCNQTNDWILLHFGWLFTWTAFLFLIVLAVIYFSPAGKIKIGGVSAQPILSRWKWFAIALCTTVATGIFFWGMAEPLYHLHQPPAGLGIEANSTAAATFSMATMFMHWSFTPYGIYTIAGLLFALVYYNLKQPFRISSLLFPILGQWTHSRAGTILDIICLVALISGMAASLGTGIFALMGGLENTLQVTQSDVILGLIGVALVTTYILSTISGLKKGISILSDWNTRAFFGLAGLLFLLGPTTSMLQLGTDGFVDYVYHFPSRSTNITSNIDEGWMNTWTVFYFANWFAWAPIAALFLGRLSVGYTIRDFINYNLVFPAVFTCAWMIIFSGASLGLDMSGDGSLFTVLNEEGEENIMFMILGDLPYGYWISLLALLMIFISYVTAADSNISAMSAITTSGISPENPEAPILMKIVWGSLVGLIAWVMITSAGVDGIRMLCVLGGFPALFILILVGLGLIRTVFVVLGKSG